MTAARPWEVVVVGAGAAGLMAAIFAASAGARVLLLERTRDGGRKILISGGGRCNVLPSELSPSQYFTASSPNTLRKMLLAWPLNEQRAFFERDLGLELALEPETGKLFPASNRARDVRDGLLARARASGAEPKFESQVVGLEPLVGGGWKIALAGSEPLQARAVIIATGGLSVPQTGSDGTGLRVLREMGYSLNPTYPALTPLTADPPRHAPLAGVSLEVRITAPAGRETLSAHGGFLFTHRGYSGPSVLDVSHMAVRSRAAGGERQPLLVRWSALDEQGWEDELREASGGTVIGRVRRHLPERLAQALVDEAGVDPHRGLAHLRREERGRLVEALAAYRLPWTGDEGYKKAEVTGGGVALSEVHPRSLESRRHAGLFLCGEVLDAFGPIGGYNFAWAWSTGRAAGLGAAESLA